ncbi:DgyrCDS7058 [Dimorphilus gyrociliatus]|uniref:DgyrCDS7058 n=1 Tax=Dimorphilus gyrociliatus TaxID=2664684 RepID=A0A7I8VUV8_9ANNE|nr:DgyrCDS7058 [Dimorphilus gyrociliatus]
MDSKEHWKTKYEESEKKLNTLKDLANAGVTDYESLLAKYNENYEIHQKVCTRLEDTEKKLQQLQTVAEPAIEAFMQLKTRHEIEEECRRKAENYASQVYKENKQLKRQSALLLQHVDNSQLSIVELGNLTDKNETEDHVPDNRHLNILIEDLKDQLAKKDAEFRVIDNERSHLYQQLRAMSNERDQLKQSEDTLKKTLDHVSSLSKKAAKQYEELEERYLRETELKEEIAKRSVHLKAERDSIVRQSAHILLEASKDEQLQKALFENDNLILRLEELKQQKEKEISELMEKLDKSRERKEINDLKMVIETCEQENNLLRKDLKSLETNCVSLENEKDQCIKEINYLKKLVQASQSHNKALRKESTSSLNEIHIIDSPDTNITINNHTDNQADTLQKLVTSIQTYFREIEVYFSTSNKNPDKIIAELFENQKQSLTKLENELKAEESKKKESEKHLDKLQKEIIQLEKDLEVANQRLKSNIPIPPLPPPPPIAIFKPLVDIIKGNKSKKSLKTNEPESKLHMNDAINEMMERIRSGKTLKKVTRRMKRSKSLPSNNLKPQSSNNEILRNKRGNLIKLDAIDEQNNNDGDDNFSERNSTDL